MHGGHQSCVVRRLTVHLVLNDQALPYRIDSWCLWQKIEHSLDPRQLGGDGRGRHAKAVLFGRPRSDNAKLYKVLGHDVEVSALVRQQFKSAWLFRIEDGEFVVCGEACWCR